MLDLLDIVYLYYSFDHQVENGTPLFLGTDLLDYTVNHHLLKNGHRIHARYAKEGVATKLTLAGRLIAKNYSYQYITLAIS